MGIMYLSTIERVKAFANKTGTQDDLELMACLSAASGAIQSYMSRGVHVESRIESRWPNPSGILFLKSYPVRSIASVEVSNGIGGYTLLGSSTYWLEDDNELHIYHAIPNRTPIRITYTGGMAYSVDTSTESVDTVTGSPTGAFTTSNGAAGTIVSYNGTAKTAAMKCHYGAFTLGDVVTGTAWNFTLTGTVQESILSDFPDLARACDMQAVYMFQRKNSLGRNTVQAGGTTTFVNDYELLPGVKQIIEYYDPQIMT